MRNSTLLTSGMIAGPLFIIVSLILAFTGEGFDVVRHPASLLALGDLGWIQIANFVVSGVLFIALAIGLRRVLTSGVGSRWLPILFGLVGVAMIIGGVFVPDRLSAFRRERLRRAERDELAFNSARLCADSGISRTYRRIRRSRAAVPLRGKAHLDVCFHCSGCRNARSYFAAEYDRRLEDWQVQFPTALGGGRARLCLFVTRHRYAKERTRRVVHRSYHSFQGGVALDVERLGAFRSEILDGASRVASLFHNVLPE